MEKRLEKSATRAYYMAASLNYFSYFLLVPFSIRWDPLTFQYKLNSSIVRKTYYILCNLGYIFTAFVWSSKVGCSVKNNPRDLMRIFELIMLLSIIFSYIYCVKVVVFQRDKLTLLLTDLKKYTQPVSEKQTLGTCFLFSCVIVCFYMYNFIYTKGAIRSFVSAVDKILLPFSILDLKNSTATVENVVDYAYYIIWPTMGFFCMPEFVAVSIVLSLWELAKCFREELCKITSFDKGYSIYKTYRKLFNDINDLWSPIFLIIYIGSVAYYGQAPYAILKEHPDMSFVVFLFENLIIWGLGSHVHKTMTSTVKEWIKIMEEEKSLSLENRMRLMSLSHEIDTEPVGITCSFFTLTYSFLGSMIGLLVTYGSIVHQNSN